jgi:PAS domain S-box-containing protein
MQRRGGSEQPAKGRRVNGPKDRSKARKASIAAPSIADLQKQVGSLTRQLREAREEQTATAEVLQVINSSSGDLTPVFQAMLEKAMRLCDANFGILWTYDGKRFRPAALHGLPAAFVDFLSHPIELVDSAALGDIARARGFVHVADLASSGAHAESSLRRATVDLGGARTGLGVPLHKGDALLGIFVIYRQEVRPFTGKEIALVQNFAAQAVIAIENAQLLSETREALERQTATAEVLQVINSSPGDLTPVFEAILEKAHRLCAVAHGSLQLYDGRKFRAVAVHGLSQAFADKLRQGYVPGPNVPGRRLIEGARFAHVADLGEIDDPTAQAAVELSDIRTTLFVPLRKDDTLLGQIVAARKEVRPFTEKEIALVENFAAQAVIAIENARLLGELRLRTRDLEQSLEQQTATADVLKVISRSTVDLETVLNTLAETATRLCRADDSTMFSRRDDKYHLVAAYGVSEEAKEFVRTHPFVPDRGTLTGRVVLERRVVHIPDVLSDPEYTFHQAQKMVGYRSMLSVPLLRSDELIGTFSVHRTRVEPFTSKEIDLATTFADQAVIAIENARLFEELRERTADLARSVDELTATGDVLKIISRSTVDLETVLDTLVETVSRLCRADQATLFRRRDDLYHLVAARGLSEQAKEFVLTHPVADDRGTLSGRVTLERRAVHIPDVLQDEEYTYRDGQEIVGFRTMLGVPLLREETLVGILILSRTRVDPFTPKEIELVTSFADQAVIAIENARLFEELRDRQAELRVTFDNMGDGVVMFGADSRLVAWNRNFQEILDLPDAFLAQRPSYIEYFRYLAARGEYSADLEAELSRTLDDTSRELRFERTRPDGRVIEVRRNPVPGGGFVLIYADITERKQAEEAIRAARDAAEAALRELQKTQASLVHAQKMAALGQLTAGIAHEIKNPLNFVNNFAGLSVELLDELKDTAAEAIGALDADKRAEIFETIGMLTGNLEKIAEHGRRADGIVRGMLQHSRGSSGDWQATDLNALVQETLNLAYHGARAQDQNFNVTLELDLDNLALIDVVPQDVSRVLLNLISNGFYAVTSCGREEGSSFRPTVKVTTREFGEGVEIRVRDNGVGVPPEHREKLFQPFFTTKPTGEGTGLGLSISYEIVTQQHGGTITVDSNIGEFTEFTVRLPRRRRGVPG